MRERIELDHAYLKSIVFYEKDTGIFIWIKSRSHKIKIGQRAGWINKANNYYYLSIDGVQYRVSRLAWFYIYAKWPQGLIDHINKDTLDNKLSNLREATPTQNQANRRINKNNKSGFKGVYFFKRTGRWRAGITVNGKGKSLGYFDTAEEAYAAYLHAAVTAFGDFHSKG